MLQTKKLQVCPSEACPRGSGELESRESQIWILLANSANVTGKFRRSVRTEFSLTDSLGFTNIHKLTVTAKG